MTTILTTLAIIVFAAFVIFLFIIEPRMRK